MQKRGVIVDADDFGQVTGTYPPHPISKIIPNKKTKTELQQNRRKENSDFVAEKKKTWEEANPQYVEHKEYKNEFQVEKPKNTSIKLIKAQDKKDARMKAGLTEEGEDCKQVNYEPGLTFMEKPHVTSKAELEKVRKQEMMQQLRKVEVNMGNFKEKKHRLEEREEAIRRLGYKDGPVRNNQTIKEEMKREMIENMTSKYGNVTVGIHGQELPKFREV